MQVHAMYSGQKIARSLANWTTYGENKSMLNIMTLHLPATYTFTYFFYLVTFTQSSKPQKKP